MKSKQSARIPGQPYRYINRAAMTEADDQTLAKLEVHGDGEMGIPVRTATREDGLKIGQTTGPRHIK